MTINNLTDKLPILKSLCLILFFLFLKSSLTAQSVAISGTVTDERTGVPIPYVNVFFKGTTIGTTTDTLGRYNVKIPAKADTIRFSAIGYRTVEIRLPSSPTAKDLFLPVKMQDETIDIREVQIKPDDGPIRRLMDKIITNKGKNNPAQYQRYSYRKYSRWDYKLSNISDWLFNLGAFKNHQSLFRTDENGVRYLPAYLSEQIVFNEIQKDPPKQKSTVIADKTDGVGLLNELRISGYTSALDIEVNFYDNTITLFTQNFISPLSDRGWFYYKYFLADSTVVDGNKHYRVNFQPRRDAENTFKGYFIADDKHFSIVEIDADLSSTNNINFMKKLRLKSNYTFVNDSIPFYKRNEIDAFFDVIPFEVINKNKQRLSVTYNQIATIDQVTVNQDTDVELTNSRSRYETINQPNALRRDSMFWIQHRMEPLTSKQQKDVLVIDSVSKIPAVEIGNRLVRMGMTKYYDAGKFEIGPVTSFFNTNKVEDLNIFFGARTSTEISENWMIWAGLGFGTRNKKFNGMAGVGYKFNALNRRVVKLSYDDKMIRQDDNVKYLYLNENNFTTSSNNVISQLFKREDLTEILREQRISATYEHEWHPGLMQSLTGSYTQHHSPEFYPFTREQTPINKVSAYEITFDTRLSREEKIVDYGFQRFYIETRFPIVHLTMAAGQVFYNNKQDWYGRLATTIKHDLFLGQSELEYAIEAGIFFGKLPYTMLDIPRGNETYGLFKYNCNMLDYLEYVNDKYIHIFADYHLNGFFFRRLPLIRRTSIREVLSAKVLFGSLSNKHNAIVDFPAAVSGMNKPYIEVGAGIENIVRLLRIDVIWRIQPESLTGAPTIGIRGRFEVRM